MTSKATKPKPKRGTIAILPSDSMWGKRYTPCIRCGHPLSPFISPRDGKKHDGCTFCHSNRKIAYNID